MLSVAPNYEKGGRVGGVVGLAAEIAWLLE